MAPGMGEEVAETQPVAASPTQDASSEISSLPDEPGLTQDTSKLIEEMKDEIKRSKAETRDLSLKLAAREKHIENLMANLQKTQEFATQ